MRDAKKIHSANLQKQTDKVLDILETDPYQNPPPFEKLMGNLNGCCSRRVNIQHRVVYKIEPEDHTVRILRMFSHYGGN